MMAPDVESVKAAPSVAEDLKPSVNHTDHAEGNALLVDRHGAVRKVPVPSGNPNDPLNFKPWEKWGVIVTCCWFSIMSLALAGGLGPILGVFGELYAPGGYGRADISLLLTLPSLFIGIGNYIILPGALAFGRRPVFLISSVILLFATIGSAASNTYVAHLSTRVVQGLATGASESLLPLMITEVTFLHERGQIFGLYWTTQTIVGACLNLASSYEVDALGWRWYYWIFSIAVAIGLVLAVFFGFETRFARPAVSLDGRIIVTDDFGVTRVISDDEAQAYLEQHGGEVPSEHDDTPKKTYGQLLTPWSEPHSTPWKMIVTSWAYMAQSMASPAILFAVLSSSVCLGCTVCMSLTYDTVLRAYGWQPQDIGLVNVASIVGSLLGSTYCTFLGEPFVLWMARRNHGIHKPEHRLVVLVPMGILGVAMLVLYGFSAEFGVDGTRDNYWGALLGWGFFQTTWIAVLIVTTTFAAEASPKHPGPALVMVVGTKNLVSFGVAYGMTPMVERGGYAWSFGVLAGIFGAIFVLGIPVYYLNPKWRRYITRREEEKGVTTTD